MLLYCDSTGGRGAAFITVIIVDGIVVDNDGIVDNNGDFLTPFLTETIGKGWFDEADTTIDR